jgi:hypothetical protein
MVKPNISIPLEEIKEIIPDTQGLKTYEQDKLNYALQRNKLYREAWSFRPRNDKKADKMEEKLMKLDEYFGIEERIELLSKQPTEPSTCHDGLQPYYVTLDGRKVYPSEGPSQCFGVSPEFVTPNDILDIENRVREAQKMKDIKRTMKH